MPSAYVVRRPRVTDAVGQALLGVFATDMVVPGEMQRLLRILDRY